MNPVPSRKVVLGMDCEGPTVQNDHAYEVAAHFLDDGALLFEQLGRFDDYTAYVRRRPQYNAGDTLRLLLPFLKASHVSDRQFESFTRSEGINWIEGAIPAVLVAQQLRIPIFEISASYRPFTLTVARKLRIPTANVYCTDFGLDRFEMTYWEAQRVNTIARKIKSLPRLAEGRVDATAENFTADERAVFAILEDLVWGEMMSLPCSGQMLTQIRAMGGREKASALFDAIGREEAEPSETIFIGDSITDVEAFKALRSAGGVTISFNGNRHAATAAEFVAWGESALVNALLIAVFATEGREKLTQFVRAGKVRASGQNASIAAVRAKLGKRRVGFALSSDKDLEGAVRKSLKFRESTRKHAAPLS